jgi:hypothetical protein
MKLNPEDEELLHLTTAALIIIISTVLMVDLL